MQPVINLLAILKKNLNRTKLCNGEFSNVHYSDRSSKSAGFAYKMNKKCH